MGDLAGAVFDRARGEFVTSGDCARRTGVPARSVGVPARNVGVARPVAGNKESRADGGFETVGDVARRGSLGGSGKLSLSSFSMSAGSRDGGEMCKGHTLIEILSSGLMFSAFAFVWRRSYNEVRVGAASSTPLNITLYLSSLVSGMSTPSNPAPTAVCGDCAGGPSKKLMLDWPRTSCGGFGVVADRWNLYRGAERPASSVAERFLPCWTSFDETFSCDLLRDALISGL